MEIDVAVIGAGTAGLAAAVQLARYGIGTVVFERGEPGGQIWTANRVDNYLGLPGLGGMALAKRFLGHARRVGVRIVQEEVLELVAGKVFTIRTAERKLKAKAVIVATGAEPRRLDGVDGRTGSMLMYDTRELADFWGKDTIILGGGDAALDRALRLKNVCSRIRVLSRGSITAHPGLVAECRRAGIKMVQDVGSWNVGLGDGGFVITTKTGSFQAGAVLASLGKEPRTSLLPRTIEQLAPTFPDGKTRLPGLYLVGDIAAGRFRQTSVAAGMGVAAAMHAADFLKRWHGIKVKGGSGWR